MICAFKMYGAMLTVISFFSIQNTATTRTQIQIHVRKHTAKEIENKRTNTNTTQRKRIFDDVVVHTFRGLVGSVFE